MDISRKIARLIYPQFRFGESDINDALKLVKLGVGGFCLYGGSVDEVLELTRTLRSYSDHPLLFAADYENGVGQWVSGATKLVSNMAIAASGDVELARRKAEITAIESDALGVDWVFAPVADIANNHINPIVNLRAFSDDIDTVIKFSKSYISGLNSFNILNSVKHFPGHGDTSVDSHMMLPEIEKDEDELENFELMPFKALSELSDSFMIAHLKILSLDKTNPASLSKRIITDILRNRMKYNKTVITDALMMKAISNETESGVRAFLAGADILLYPTDPYKLYYALMENYSRGIITDAMVDLSIKRQDQLVRKRNLSMHNTKDLSVIGSSDYKKFVEEISSLCISWVKKISTPVDKKIFYFETLGEEKPKGEFFIDELKKLGFEIKNDISDCDVIIISSFSKPKAFSGAINLGSKEKEEVDRMIKTGKKIIFISFGSPFVFDGYVKNIDGGICCFSDIKEFQITAARALKGITDISGKLPVKINE